MSNLSFVNFAVDTDSDGSVFMMRTTCDLTSVSPEGEALPGATKNGFSNIMVIAFDDQGKMSAFHEFPDTLIMSQVQMRSMEFAQGVSFASVSSPVSAVVACVAFAFAIGCILCFRPGQFDQKSPYAPLLG